MYRIHVVLGGWPGAPGLYTAYFADVAVDKQAGAADAVERVRTFFDSIKQYFAIPTTIAVSGDVDSIDPADGSLIAQYSVTPPVPFTGIGSNTFNAFPAMFLLRIRTSSIVGTHRVQGRSFLGPTSSDTDVNGAPTAPVGAAIATAARAMITGPTVIFPVVWTRPKPANPLATPPTAAVPGAASAVVDYSVSPKWAVLTSRRD